MRFFYVVGLVGAGLAGCESEQSPERPRQPPEGLNALRAEVSAGRVVSGFEHGRLRKELDVTGFTISRRPITIEQFRTCVTAGACRDSVSACANPDGHDQDAALCVGLDNARAYCRWSGGRLPRLSEWFLAARGRNPQRFSWGNRAPTCADHALAPVPLEEQPLDLRETFDRREQTPCGEPRVLRLRVGEHQAGASPYGLEDVLIGKAELLASHPDSNFGVCRKTDAACLVYGLIAGAIDSVKEFSGAAAPGRSERRVDRSLAMDAYTFRCVWSQEGA